jgi:hypothetical protein
MIDKSSRSESEFKKLLDNTIAPFIQHPVFQLIHST